MLLYYLLKFQLYWSIDVEMETIFCELSDHSSYLWLIARSNGLTMHAHYWYVQDNLVKF